MTSRARWTWWTTVVGVAPTFLIAVASWAWTHAWGVDALVARVVRVHPEPVRTITLRNVRLASPLPSEPHDAIDLRVEAGSIAAIGPAGSLVPRGDDRVLDGEGRALTLGMVDAHVAAVFRDPLRHALPPSLVRDALRLEARAGVTSVRDLGSPAAALRRLAIAMGTRLVGPSIEPGGPWLELPGAAGPALDPFRHRTESRPVRSAGDVARAVDDGGFAAGQWLAVDPPANDDTREGRALLDSVSEAAKAHNLRLAVRALDEPALRWALEVGAESIEELARYPRELTPELVARIAASGAVVVPLAHLARVAEVGSSGAYERDRQTRWIGRASWWGPLASLDRGIRAAHAGADARAADRARVDALRENLAQLRAMGVPIALGTGAPRPFAFAERPGDEIEALAAAGLAPTELVETATRSARRLLDDRHAGARIAVGAAADLVVWDCDPAREVRCFARPRWVIVAGRALDGRNDSPARPFL